VYVTVAVGETVREPDANGCTKPIPWSSENEAAFAVVHESVAKPPVVIEAGPAESVQVGAAGCGVAYTFTWQFAAPPGPMAVPVKTVSEIMSGVMAEPAATGVTLPMRLSIEKAVELAVVHERMDEPPAITEIGLAESVQVGAEGGGGGGGGVTVTVAEQYATPPEPIAVPVYVMVAAGEIAREPEEAGTTVPIL